MSNPELKRMGLTEARANLTEVVSQVRILGEPVVLTRRDKAQAVVIPMELWERVVSELLQPEE